MKFFNCVFDFSNAWRDVATAVFQRYPNPFSKHVLTEDVLERFVAEDGKLHTVKLLTKTNPLPRWGERFYRGPKFVTIIEESVVDPATQTFTTYNRNISMVHFMSCAEKCVYKAKDAGVSAIEKSAWLDSTMGYGLRIPILEFSIQRYKSNQKKATLGLEYAISHRLPLTLRDVVRHKTEQLTETAKLSKEVLSQKANQSKELFTQKANQSKEILTQKAKKASNLAKTRAEQATAQAKSKASEV